MRKAVGTTALLAAALTACATVSPQARSGSVVATQPVPAPVVASSPIAVEAPERAVEAGVVADRSLPAFAPAEAMRALAAFRLSCPSLRRRSDLSGLTEAGDWDGVCARAEQTPAADAAAFFRSAFVPVRIGDGRLFATGYYEPELAGSRTRRPGYEIPVHGKPVDLIEVDLGNFSTSLAGKRIRGRIVDGTLVPYFDRAEIEGGALAGRAGPIAWAADPVAVFFLQIQGSGRLRLPDGGVMRVGYAGQNGHDYTSIGRLLRERGELQAGQATMQGIVGWLRENPARGAALMRENESYVFFRELTGPGPLGALGLPVTPRVSVAADPRFVPLGAPVVLSSDRPEVQGLWVAQDTGGAIKGANRFDTFWGAGDEAETIAGGMSARGAAWLLLPPDAVRRLTDGS